MRRPFAILLAVFSLLFLLPSAAATDPVVTLSYLEESYLPSILDQADELIDHRLDELWDSYVASLEARSSQGAIYAALLHQAGYTVDAEYGMGGYLVTRDDAYALPLGTMVSMTSGMVSVEGNGVLVDLAEGRECFPGELLTPGHAYLSAGEMAAGLRVLSPDAELAFTGHFAYLGMTPPAATSTAPSGPHTARYTRYADALHIMGLFLGSDRGYELERVGTRVEAVVMLIRLLGEESAALSGDYSHPFRDVPKWANQYVAYAYEMGYTAGVSSRAFAPDEEITSPQYLTFLLRALGYDDSRGDFLWSEADQTAQELGLITAAERRSFSDAFYRDHMAYTSYRALSMTLSGLPVRLIDKLLESGAVSYEAYLRAWI